MIQDTHNSNGKQWHCTLAHICAAIAFIFAVCLSPVPSRAQVTPAEGSKLNYRIIGFSFPAGVGKGTSYTIEIANGNLTDDKQFKDHVHQSVPSERDKVIIEVPSFGTQYTWRVLYKKDNAVATKSKLYHFATGTIPPYAGDSTRLRVKANTEKYKDGYILVDGSNKIYDMNGAPVWYLPDTDPVQLEGDAKVSPSGTITFLAGKNAYEVSYSGKVLWDAKNKCGLNDPTINDFVFHHEFSRLANGHYMALLAPIVADDPLKVNTRKKFFPTMSASTLVEFDRDGNSVWSWESSAYMQACDLHFLKERHPKLIIDLHENAFYFDEKDSVIYLSMSGVSRIVKIKYPSGKVLDEYGRKVPGIRSDDEDSADKSILKMEELLVNPLFYHQHSLSLSADGYLCVFNNNSLLPGLNPEQVQGNYPQVLALKEAGDTLAKEWDFDCKNIIKDRKLMSAGSAGGSIISLPDNSLFVSMSTPYGDVFIVDSGKHILWHGLYEKYNPEKSDWVECAKYRASIISRKQLEQMVWSGN